MSMKAMLLAAGRGTRMQPLTNHTPKPLLKVGGKPLIVWHLERLAKAGFTDIIINHAWLGDQIESCLGRGNKWGLNIAYSPETTALETAGGIAQALPMLGSDPFLVINADVWCDWNPSQSLLEQQRLAASPNLLAWLLLVDNPTFHPNGDFYLDPQGWVSDQQSSDNQPIYQPMPRLTFSGIGIYKPQLFQSLVSGQPTKLAPLLRQAMQHQQVIGNRHVTQWVDVGTPERLAHLNQGIFTAS
jgi:MurNAc alpha-1-phosphate uridylyltransferase